MAFTTTRKRAAIVLASLALLGGTTGGAAVAADSGGVGAAAYSCNITHSGGKHYAGYYSGETVVPSASQVTASGKEAQCLLHHKGYNPGTVDGIFGSNSQSATKEFQRIVNSQCDENLVVDGKVGPRTWPYLRTHTC